LKLKALQQIVVRHIALMALSTRVALFQLVIFSYIDAHILHIQFKLNIEILQFIKYAWLHGHFTELQLFLLVCDSVIILHKR